MNKPLRALWLFVSLALLLSLTGCLGGLGNSAETASPIASDSSFAVHFIDVGQADAALVLCDGKSMLIDGGNRGDGNLIYSYLQKRELTYLDYLVCTHADEDHVGGLAAALTYADAGVIYCPVKEYTSDAFNNFVEKAKERGKELTQPTAGATFSLGSAQVTVIGPVGEYNDNNNRSIVLRIVYGETSFLFTGDAEREAETDILASGAMLKSTVLKVGHHGSESSTTYPFLRAVDPDYAVISAGKDNKYGHPTEDVLSRLRDAEVKVYRTDMQGDIICTSDGKTVTFQTQKNGDALTNPTEQDTAQTEAVTEAEYYVGNVKSKKYHLPTCRSLPDEENRIIFSSKQEAIDEGYDPCGSCKP